MAKRWMAILISVLGCHCLVSAGRPFEPAADSADAKQVSLYVTVEKDNLLIQGLTEENFQLYEEGRPSAFHLAPPEKPTLVALLIEYSQSSWFYIQDVRSAMDAFLDTATEGYYYALATFDNELDIQVDFTKMRGKVSNAFLDLQRPWSGEINTYDALFELLDKLGRQSSRRILVFVGSGFDTFSSRTLEDVQRKLESVNVTVYAAAAGSQLRGYYEPYLGSSDRLKLLQAEAFLRMLADRSGGQAWFPRFESAYPDVLRGIAQNIASQYRLVYEPRMPRDGDFHEIKVRASGLFKGELQEFEVRVRAGWRFNPR